MSDPVKQAPFEDVLSSIRRLVREETGDPAQRRPRGELSATRSDDPYSEEAKQGLLDSLDLLMGRSGPAGKPASAGAEAAKPAAPKAAPFIPDLASMMDPSVDEAAVAATSADSEVAPAEAQSKAHDAIPEAPLAEASRPEALVLTPDFRIQPEPPEAFLENTPDDAPDETTQAQGRADADDVVPTDPMPDHMPDRMAGAASVDAPEKDAETPAATPPRSSIFIPQFLANRRGKVHDRDEEHAAARPVAKEDSAFAIGAEAPEDEKPAVKQPKAEAAEEPATSVSRDLPWFRPSRRTQAPDATAPSADKPEAATTPAVEMPVTPTPVDAFYEDEHAQSEAGAARFASFDDMEDGKTAHQATQDALGDVVAAMAADAAQEALAKVAEEMAKGPATAESKVEPEVEPSPEPEAVVTPEVAPAPKPKPVKDTSENVDKFFAAARAANPEHAPEPLPEDAALFSDDTAPSLNDVPDFHPDEPEVEPLHAGRLRRVAWKRDEVVAPSESELGPELEELDEVDPSERFGASGESVMDEEALRELVSQLVRRELQGELGERITRNVRKLVRREIHQMLSSRDFD